MHTHTHTHRNAYACMNKRVTTRTHTPRPHMHSNTNTYIQTCCSWGSPDTVTLPQCGLSGITNRGHGHGCAITPNIDNALSGFIATHICSRGDLWPYVVARTSATTLAHPCGSLKLMDCCFCGWLDLGVKSELKKKICMQRRFSNNTKGIVQTRIEYPANHISLLTFHGKIRLETLNCYLLCCKFWLQQP